MSWWEKGIRSVKDSAEKVSFEADKVMRIKREEGAAADLQNKIRGKLADLGQVALALYQAGTLNDPSVGAIAQDIAAMEAQVQQQREKIEAIRAEQWQPEAGSGPAAPAGPTGPQAGPTGPQATSYAPTAPTPPPAAAPVPPATPQPAVAPSQPATPAADTVECPSCHTQVRATAAFCPECGNRMH